MKIRQTNETTALSNLVSPIYPTNIVLVNGFGRTVNGKNIAIYELNYSSGTRTKRCFVAHAYLDSNTKNQLIIAFPGSNSNGNGAMDLIDPPAGDTQYQWPLQLCADYGVFAVMLDLPVFGAFPYGPTDDMADQVKDAVCGVQAARYFIEETFVFSHRKLAKGMFCGGYSWGAISAEFMTAYCPNITHAYIGSGQLSKTYDTRPMFNPPEWAVNYDYKEMLLGSSAKRIRIQFGGNGQDYLYTPFKSPFVPDVDGILSYLTTANPSKFSTKINANIGHQIDVADLKSWFSTYQNDLHWYIDQIPLDQ